MLTQRVRRVRLQRVLACGLMLSALACSNESTSHDAGDASTPAAHGTGGAAAGGSGGMHGASGSGGSDATGMQHDAGSHGGSGSGGKTGGSGGKTGGSGGSAAHDAGMHDAGPAQHGDAGSSTLANPAPGTSFFVGANFWNVDWEGAGDFFQNGVDFANTDNPWRPELLTDLKPYHVLRFMDWNKTNDSSNPQAHWDTRKQKTAAQDEPVAFEWQIDLCNRMQTDYWVTVPHEATPDDWHKVAQLIDDQLDPGLRVYLEFSNEVWNSSFPQHDYATSQAQSMSLPGSDAAAAYYVYASVRLYEAFEDVFGKGSARLVKVLSGQAAWTGPCDAHVLALADKTINPNGTQPDVYAVAPYFGGKTLDELSQAIPMVVQWIKDDVTCAAKAGLPLVSYEGGADSYAAGDGCKTLQHDAGMHDLYMTYLDGISGAGMHGPFMQYTHTGTCWGLKEKTGDALADAPKYAGVVDWIAAHPP